MSEVDIIKKRLQRSIAARKEAESILESKALELYHTNVQLKELNTNLEQQVKDRTDALRASKEKYEILVEKASDFIFNIDFNGFFTYVNETGLTSMGYTWEQVIGKPFLLFVDPEHHQAVLKFKKRNGTAEYSCNFSVREGKAGDFILENHWSIDRYTKQVDYSNFQTWASNISHLSAIVNGTLELLRAEKEISNYNMSGIPDLYIKNGAYHNGDLYFTVENKEREV